MRCLSWSTVSRNRAEGRSASLSDPRGNLSQQILRGAPFELFLSADQHYVDRLAKQGKTVDSGHVYAIGQLVLFAPTGSNLRPEPHLDHLSKLVSQGTLGRFAIANPRSCALRPGGPGGAGGSWAVAGHARESRDRRNRGPSGTIRHDWVGRRRHRPIFGAGSTRGAGPGNVRTDPRRPPPPDPAKHGLDDEGKARRPKTYTAFCKRRWLRPFSSGTASCARPAAR